MFNPSNEWTRDERLKVIVEIICSEIVDAAKRSTKMVPHTFIRPSEVAAMARAIAENLEGEMTTIATRLRDLGNVNWTTHGDALASPLNPLEIEDWGNRILALIHESASYLEANRAEILRGNPARYQ